jgi:hypothetical protein
MQPDFVVLVVVPPVVVVLTVSVLPTLHPEATKAANNAAEIVSARLLFTIEFVVWSHAILSFLFKIWELRCSICSGFIVS